MIQKLPSQETIEDLVEENARFTETDKTLKDKLSMLEVNFLLPRTDKYPTSPTDVEEQVLSSDIIVETSSDISSDRDIQSRMDRAQV